MKKNFEFLYEILGGTYREENGHLIPNVTLPEQTDYQIGKYGRMHLDYIKNHRRGRYTTLLTEGELNAHLHEIDLEANKMLETIIPRLAAERGIDENLKACDMLRWVAEMNSIKASAEEIILREVVLV
ncbi:MAG: TnpV protein [Clostridia bacterium]|nr:TnpV protein [Clostridia bacterium]